MREFGSHLDCPRCGLSIAARYPWLAMTHCPRCIARAGVAVRLFSSELPTPGPYANAERPQ
jgi:hypothetical protein